MCLIRKKTEEEIRKQRLVNSKLIGYCSQVGIFGTENTV